MALVLALWWPGPHPAVQANLDHSVICASRQHAAASALAFEKVGLLRPGTSTEASTEASLEASLEAVMPRLLISYNSLLQP